MTASAEEIRSRDERARTYARLAGRNRLVAILRIGIPAIGLVVVGAVMLQLYLLGRSQELGVASVLVDRDSILVESPRYAGVMADGTNYLLTSKSAKAPVDMIDKIDLTDADFLLSRLDGSTMTIDAHEARVDTTNQWVTIDDLAYVKNSDGIHGTMEQMFIDWSKQLVSADGPVHLVYPNGMIIDSVGMHYDPETYRWRFDNAVVRLPRSMVDAGMKPGTGEVP